MTTRSTVTPAALAVALIALAGVLIWVGVTQATGGRSGTVPSLALAVLPLVAAWLLFKRPAVGATLAVVAALLGAGAGLVLNFCLCPMPPLGPEFVALFVAAALAFALALLQLVTLGLGWFVLAILVALLAISGTVGIVAAAILVAAAVIWLLVRRRRSGGGASANGT
jgi:hypothetical protein